MVGLHYLKHAFNVSDETVVARSRESLLAILAKGKAHKPYEFGVKVGVVTTSRESFVVGMQALPGNHWTHTQDTIGATRSVNGRLPKEAYVDRGLPRLWHRPAWALSADCRAKRRVTVAIKKKLKRRNAVEPQIGHMKADGRLARNFLKGTQG